MAMPAGRMSVGLRTWIVPVLAVLWLLPGLPGPAEERPVAGQQQSAPPAVGLVRSTTRLVQISVIATDKKGEPVEDLTRADFVVLDNDRRQEIQIFQRETNQRPANPSLRLPPDTYTNQIHKAGNIPPSVTMLLLDGLNTGIGDQAYARQQVIKFLLQIHANDCLAIFTLGRDLHILQGLSGSSKLVAALGKYSGQTTVDFNASTPTDIQTGSDTMDALLQDAFQKEANMYLEDRVRTTVGALIDIANFAAGLPGRKNLVWVSGSFPFSVGYENLETLVRMINDPKRESSISGQQLFFAEEIERAARALNDANIAVYPVDARGLMGLSMNTANGTNKNAGYGAMNSGQQNRGLNSGNPGGGGGRGGGRSSRGPKIGKQNQNSSMKQGPSNPMLDPDNTTMEAMDALANGTGGKAFYNSSDLSSSLRTVLDDSRVTYEIGYYPSDVKWNGSYHRITVESKKPDLLIRARMGYFALPETAPSPEVLRGVVTNAAASPLESTGMAVAVRVQATTREHGTVINAMIFFDPRSMQFDVNGGQYNGSVNLALVQFDDKNQILNAGQQSFPLNLSSGQYEQFLKQQVELTQEIKVLPNATQLRVVLCDGKTGKVGTVAVPLAKYLSPH